METSEMVEKMRNEYQKVLVEALREAAETLTPEKKEDVLESMRKGGFCWGIRALYGFGTAAKEAFIEALIQRMNRLGKEARHHGFGGSLVEVIHHAKRD